MNDEMTLVQLETHFENRRTSLAGAKLTLLEFLFSTGLVHSTLIKVKDI